MFLPVGLKTKQTISSFSVSVGVGVWLLFHWGTEKQLPGFYQGQQEIISHLKISKSQPRETDIRSCPTSELRGQFCLEHASLLCSVQVVAG